MICISGEGWQISFMRFSARTLAAFLNTAGIRVLYHLSGNCSELCGKAFMSVGEASPTDISVQTLPPRIEVSPLGRMRTRTRGNYYYATVRGAEQKMRQQKKLVTRCVKRTFVLI